MSNYSLTVGLEVHAELSTSSKMFCACRNDPNEKAPNTNICPVCMAHPGTLPVINKEAVHKVLFVGAALGGTLADYTEFDRKSYFYPDIPKGYQISQYKHPLVAGGSLEGIAITRVHLEEDTARSQHLPAQAGQGESSLVDYNRAGVPLMELVTDPVIKSAEDAARFGRELQLLLRTLGVGEANMEKGQMRVEANISVSAGDTLGTKVEVKNLNSFRSVERAIAYEFARQSELLEKGGAIEQETRGWDERVQKTYPQRKKESSHDYRYFPDPDLPSLRLSEIPEFSQDTLTKSLPELPQQKRLRLGALGFLQAQDIEQLVGDEELAGLFAQVEQKLQGQELRTAANFILNDIAGARKKNPVWKIPSADFLAEVVASFSAGTISSPQAKSSLLSGTMAAVGDSGELSNIAKEVIDSNPTVVVDYRAGKAAALQFLVGQGMKQSRGSANPQALREAILDILG